MTDKPPSRGGAPAGSDGADSGDAGPDGRGDAVSAEAGQAAATTDATAEADPTPAADSTSAAPSAIDATTTETNDTTDTAGSRRGAAGAAVSHEATGAAASREAAGAAAVAVATIAPPELAQPEASSADAETTQTGTETTEAGGSRRRGKVVGIVLAVIVVVLGIAYGVAFAVAGDSLARGATVAGVDVGGMTPAEAEATLTEALPAVVDQPIHLTLGDGETSFEIVPSQAGLTIDVPATVGAIPGGSANPVSLVQALLGAGETTPVPSVDGAVLEAALTEIADQANTEPVNGAVAFDGGQVVTSEPQLGRAVDVQATAQRLEGVFFRDQAELPIGDVPLVVTDVEPAVSAAEVERAVTEFAQPAMAAPVTVVAGEHSVAIPPELIGQALTMTPDDAGTLQPALDGATLAELAHDLLAEVGQEGKDATVTIQNGTPTVVPAETGQGISPDALGAAVLPVLTEQGEAREAAVELTEVDPELTTQAAEDLGVTEVVAEFTTRFPHADYRNVNIGTAAERIDNTLLLPGEEFSLNTIVGERTEANGFTSGTIINSGRLEESLGGGVSQVATTTFHAAFQAGLEDVEHWPHSIYFDRYPVGQEATVAWGAKDMRFANDTPYGVVVDTSFTSSSPGRQGSLTIRIWSTDHYRVETSVSERYDFTSPRTIYDNSSDCSAQGGSQGFSITSYRKVWTPDGTLVKDESEPWTYNPNHRVICGSDPDD